MVGRPLLLRALRQGVYESLLRLHAVRLHEVVTRHVQPAESSWSELDAAARTPYNPALNLTVTPLACARVAPAG